MVNKYNKVIVVDEEMLEAITEQGGSAQTELNTSNVIMDLGTIKFLKVLRKNFVLDRLQMQLASAKPEDVQEFYISQRALDAQVALLTYLIDIHTFNKSTTNKE